MVEDATVSQLSHFCKVLNLSRLLECAPALHCGFAQSCQSLATERWEPTFTLGKMLGRG